MELLQPGESSRLMVESDFNKKLKTLSQIEDKTYSEIADDLGIEISSVGKALWNAKKELKEIINNERHLIPQEIQPYIELLLQKQ